MRSVDRHSHPLETDPALRLPPSGALVVFRRGSVQRPIDPEEDSLVRALADQAAIALEHASQFREVR